MKLTMEKTIGANQPMKPPQDSIKPHRYADTAGQPRVAFFANGRSGSALATV